MCLIGKLVMLAIFYLSASAIKADETIRLLKLVHTRIVIQRSNANLNFIFDRLIDENLKGVFANKR